MWNSFSSGNSIQFGCSTIFCQKLCVLFVILRGCGGGRIYWAEFMWWEKCFLSMDYRDFWRWIQPNQNWLQRWDDPKSYLSTHCTMYIEKTLIWFDARSIDIHNIRYTPDNTGLVNRPPSIKKPKSFHLFYQMKIKHLPFFFFLETLRHSLVHSPILRLCRIVPNDCMFIKSLECVIVTRVRDTQVYYEICIYMTWMCNTFLSGWSPLCETCQWIGFAWIYQAGKSLDAVATIIAVR